MRGFRVAAHVLGHSRLVCDARVLEILSWHHRPRRAAEVAEHFGESERAVTFVLGHLVQAQLLASEDLDVAARIRSAFAARRSKLARVAPSIPLAGDVIEEWAAPVETEVSALRLTTASRLVLSPFVASMRVRAGETIALHPLGPRVHMKDALWRLARAFQKPCTIASAAMRLGLRPDEVVSACRFLALRGLLWPSRAAERRAFDVFAAKLDVRVDGASIRQWSEPLHQWTDVAVPVSWRDVRRTRAFGRVAMIGQCQASFCGAALQRLALAHHVHLDVHGEPTPSEALARTPWSAVVVSLADHAGDLHAAAARGDWEQARALVPAIASAMDDLVLGVRRWTDARLAVLSVSPPSLSSVTESSGARHLRAHIYADLNQRLAAALRASGGVLLDESSLLDGGVERVILDDEYTGAAHHCTFNPRFWNELTQWATPSFAPVPAYPSGDPQAGASDALAAGLFDLLRRENQRVPVRAVVFDPDTLLWPGHVAGKPAAHDSLERSLGRPDYQFYCGVNEALLAVRARGVKLVCVSAVPAWELAQKWNVPASTPGFVSHAHVDGVAEDARGLDAVLDRLGVRREECLAIGLGPRLTRSEMRVFRADRWSLKRYLLTAPELTAAGRDELQPPRAPQPTESEAGRAPREAQDANVSAVVDAAIARHLGTTPEAARRSGDLRRLGLDSLTALELAHDIEARLGVKLAGTDLTIATLYRRSTLVEAAERARVRSAASASGRARPAHRTSPLFACDDVAELIARHVEAARHPWQIKMLRSARANDYEYAGWATLVELASGYAELYADLGAKRGDVVTLMLPQGIPLVAAYLGALLHGFVPSIVAAPSEKLSESTFVEWFGEVAARSGTRVVACAVPHEPLVRACIAASRTPDVAVTSAHPTPVPRARVARGRAAGSPLLLQHSSGTTGLKKAVLLPEGAVVAQLRHLSRALRCDAEGARDVVVSWAPLYHDMGLIACLLLPLLADLPLVMMSPFDWLRSPEILLREVTLERGTLSWMPNFGFMYSAQRIGEEALEGLDLSSWRAVVNCSEPVTEAAAQAFHRRFARVGLRRSALSASFAMAETTFAVTQVPPGRGLVSTAVDGDLWRSKGIARRTTDPSGVVVTGSGALLDGTALEIVDERGHPVAAGVAGEIRVRSDSLMMGYFGDEATTRAALQGGWYSTGDLGFMLDGELYVTGRKKDLIIVAGHNVYPHDVEESVGAIRGIKPGRVVALGVADDALGTDRLVLLAETLAGEDDGDAAALKEQVRAHVSAVFGVAVHDVRLFGERTLLKSTSGKLSRSRNRAFYIEQVAAELRSG